MNKPPANKQQAGKKSAAKGRGKAADEQQRHSEDIERAVYDGMQDLRVKREPKR